MTVRIWRNFNTCALLMRLLNGVTSMENNVGLSQKIKIWISIWSINPTFGMCPKEFKAGSWRDICISMFMAALFTIAKRQKQPKWMDKQGVIHHTVEYSAALKRNEILTHATTWMKLKDIMLSETSQSQKEKYYMIPFICGF